MLIQCCIPERDNIVKLGLTTYRFKQNDAGHLVCNVEDEAAQNHFLGLPEYKIYTNEEDPEDKEDPDFGAPVPDVAPVKVNINEPLKREWLESRTYEELQEIFKHRFGKAAHPSSKHEKLVERLAE